ncbi:MAG: tetratricopeptide repeat protein, partial [Verrucomicrobiae bacterium]|nr:tetratricopeptide repeat protein [Verrucomicrobiae bacterium]
RQAQVAAHSERTFTNLGHTLVVTGQTDAGLAALERAEQLNPRCPTAKYNLAVVLALRGELDGAQQKLHACLELAPDDPTGWELAAQLAEARREHRHALHHYRRAISCTLDVGVRLRFARFLLRHGRTREALATLEECQYLEPGNAGTYRLLAELLTAIGQTARAAEARELAASLDRHS